MKESRRRCRERRHKCEACRRPSLNASRLSLAPQMRRRGARFTRTHMPQSLPSGGAHPLLLRWRVLLPRRVCRLFCSLFATVDGPLGGVLCLRSTLLHPVLRRVIGVFASLLYALSRVLGGILRFVSRVFHILLCVVVLIAVIVSGCSCLIILVLSECRSSARCQENSECDRRDFCRVVHQHWDSSSRKEVGSHRSAHIALTKCRIKRG